MKPQVADLVRPFPKALTSEGNNSPDNKEGKVWIPSCTENTKRQAVTRAAQRNIVELKGKEIRLIRLYLKTLVNILYFTSQGAITGKHFLCWFGTRNKNWLQKFVFRSYLWNLNDWDKSQRFEKPSLQFNVLRGLWITNENIWFLEKTALQENRNSGTVLMFQLLNAEFRHLCIGT